MNSLYRSVSIYSRHHFFLQLYSPATKIMSSHSKASFPGDRRSPTPMNHTTFVESFSSQSNDYDEKFPPLLASTKKSGKGSKRSEADLASTNTSTLYKSSQSGNSKSGKDDASSSQRDQSLIRKKDLHSETNTPVAVKIEVDLGYTNVSTPSKRSQSPCKNRDSMRRPDLPLPHVIYAPVDRSNDTNVTDQFIKEEAIRQNVEVGNGTSSKDTRKALRKTILDLATPSKCWIRRDDSYSKMNHRDSGFKNGDQVPKRRHSFDFDDYTPKKHSQSQDWRIGNDASSSKKNQRDSGFKNGDQVPKRRQPFDICYSFHKRNNTSIKDLSIEEEEEEEAKEKETEQQHKVLRPGMVLLKHYLTHKAQVEIVKTCREFGLKPQGFYQPGYTDGAKLRLQMMCLGRNWDPQTKYSNKNIETDKIPESFSDLVTQAIKEAQALTVLPSMKSSPDICIVNFYTETGRLGLHQDRDESRESIRLGLPIVSFSIGDSAEFLYGEERDVEKAELVKLESGDVLIFGGESRMVFHGVKSIIPNSAPKCLLDESKLRRGRLNLTFRQF